LVMVKLSLPTNLRGRRCYVRVGRKLRGQHKTFIALLGGAATTWLLGARGHQPPM
jgi:hypothetical protein